MTDPITCPECDGDKVQSIGSLTMNCPFCHGRGTVGGDYEPAEGGHQRTDGYRNPIDGESYDPAVHGPLPAVQDHPAVQTLAGCKQCLNTGELVAFVDGTIARTPCPNCSDTPPDRYGS